MTITRMQRTRQRISTLAVPLSLILLSACNTATPYPMSNPIVGAKVSANPYPPGTPAFCRQYAKQSAANEYESRVSRSEDGFGIRVLMEQQARRDGARAYERCLSRRGT